MLKIRSDILSLKTAVRNIIIKIEAIPPDKLSANATKPIVINEKNDLRSARKKALFFVVKKREYIMTVFESPSFTPGGRNGNEGSILSKIDKTIIRLKSIAVIVIIFVFLSCFI